MRTTLIRQHPRGMTLIMVAAVLAILAALGTGFYTMTLLNVRASTRYSDSVRAGMMASAGVDYAISGLRQMALKKTEDPSDPWYMVDYLNGASRHVSFPDSPLLHDGKDDDLDGTADNIDETRIDPTQNLPYSRALASTAGPNSDRFNLNISDAASRINLNNCDNLAVVLDNLCRVIGPPLVAADLDAIQPGRWAVEMLSKGDPEYPLYATANNASDLVQNPDLYYWLYAVAA